MSSVGPFGDVGASPDLSGSLVPPPAAKRRKKVVSTVEATCRNIRSVTDMFVFLRSGLAGTNEVFFCSAFTFSVCVCDLRKCSKSLASGE